MAEKKSKNRSKGGGLFSGPADPFGGGLGRGKKPSRPRKPGRSSPAKASPPPIRTEPDTPKVEPTPPAAEKPSPPPPEPPKAEPPVEPAAPKPSAPRPSGIPLGGGGASARPELSRLPASMRLRIAKAEHEKEQARKAEEQASAAAPEATPAVELAPSETDEVPLDDGRRVVLPPQQERGSAPTELESPSDSFDLLGSDEDSGSWDDPPEAPGGLMGLIPEERMAPEDPEFDPAPGRVVASLQVSDNAPSHSHSDRSSLGEVDASAWDDPQSDHDALFDIRSRAQSPDDEDLEEPPSDLIGLDELPRGPVVVRKGKDAEFKRVSVRPMVEDSGVWSPEPISTPEPAQPRRSGGGKAWWEAKKAKEKAAEPAPDQRRGYVAPVPDAPGAPSPKPTPKPPSFIGKTRQERESNRRRKVALFGGLGAIAVLAIVGVLVWLSQSPEPEVDPNGPATVAPSAGDLPPPTTAPLATPPEPLPDPVPPEPDPQPEVPALPEPTVPEPVESSQPVVEVPGDQIEPGFLNIKAEPRAVIFLGRQNLGETPIERLELEPGNYTIKAVAPGKRAKTRTVRVDSGRAQQIVFRW